MRKAPKELINEVYQVVVDDFLENYDADPHDPDRQEYIVDVSTDDWYVKGFITYNVKEMTGGEPDEKWYESYDEYFDGVVVKYKMDAIGEPEEYIVEFSLFD
jgi:hypothetical protein